MDCENCGAQMTLLRNHGYFFCEYCGSFHFPEVMLSDLAAKEVVEVLIDREGDILCPMCQKPLMEAWIDGYKSWRCEKCRGTLTYQESFWEIVKERRMKTDYPPSKPEPLDRKEMSRRIECPSCQKTMETHPYYGPGRFIIQTCRFCTLIWLDFGEFGKAIRAPRSDRIWGD
jgi:Zn-finger nucleic acid-binding protein